MHDLRGFYYWLLGEVKGQPEGNPIADLVLIVINPDNSTDYTQAWTLDQWQAMLPPEWHEEVNVIFRLYQGYPISDYDYLV